jgi:hypothetical protein
MPKKKKLTSKDIVDTHHAITACGSEIFRVISKHAKRQKLDGANTYLFASRVLNSVFTYHFNMAIKFSSREIQNQSEGR